jgi:predicted nuclease of predicted toxin-antitoxin system
MGTLSTELAPHAERLSPRPRIYADANVPAGLVAYMRSALDWDVLFVMEEDQLRRASDVRHYQLASQLRRTLVTMDRDYLDDRRFPADKGAGVLVINAPDERQLAALMARIDRELFHSPGEPNLALPLQGRKLHAQTDWRREDE